MTEVLHVVVLLGTAAVVGAGIYFTLRGFKAADRPPVVDAKPRHAKSNPHDAAKTAELKHFFEGKACAACSRPIPPVHAGELRPGLLNADTHESIAWTDIPAANLSTTLERHVPICSNCLIIEGFRRQHPELVVDRHRTIENPSH
jgi:hypothetical protein